MAALPVIARAREVWQYNLEEEVSAIMAALPKCDHCFIAMGTNFPGEIYTPRAKSSRYNLMKVNVDNTPIIQLGLAISDANGKS